MISNKICLFILMAMVCFSERAIAYDDKHSHPRITEKAVEYSQIDQYLKTILNFSNGLAAIFPSDNPQLTVSYWLTKGSKLEDTPLCRSTNHFHNPLLPWDRAGISSISLPLCPFWDVASYSTRHSALTWATGYDNYSGPVISRSNQQMGWDNARSYFYSALTSNDKASREGYFAKTFQSVGQVMHLLQDMAVPAHVRNDFWNSHVWTGGSNPYELYVSLPEHAGLISNLTKQQIESVMPAFTSPRQTDFWDTSDGSVIVPVQILDPSFQSKAGLSEYTNANFVSEGTLFSNSTEFEYPKKSSTAEVVYSIADPFSPGATVKRPYWYKTQDWVVGYHLAAVDYMQYYGPESGSPAPSKVVAPLDDYVHEDYAQLLLPRAVGYSAALLNYFFRGSIKISLPPNGVYASTTPGEGSFNNVRLLAKNVTAGEEEMSDGAIHLVVRYKIAQNDPFQSGSITASDDFSYIVVPEAGGASSVPRDTPIALTFDLTGKEIPLWATDVYLQVVYKGRLGNEQDAVAVGFKDIAEPTPIVVINSMDKICLEGSWYDAGSSEAIAVADKNATGIPAYDVFPHEMRDFYLFLSSADAEPDQKINSEPLTFAPGEVRMMMYVLSDEQFNIKMSWISGLVDAPGLGRSDHYELGHG